MTQAAQLPTIPKKDKPPKDEAVMDLIAQATVLYELRQFSETRQEQFFKRLKALDEDDGGGETIPVGAPLF